MGFFRRDTWYGSHAFLAIIGPTIRSVFLRVRGHACQHGGSGGATQTRRLSDPRQRSCPRLANTLWTPSMSTAVFTSTSRRRSGARDYDRCGERAAEFLNNQNCSITIGNPDTSRHHPVAVPLRKRPDPRWSRRICSSGSSRPSPMA